MAYIAFHCKKHLNMAEWARRYPKNSTRDPLLRLPHLIAEFDCRCWWDHRLPSSLAMRLSRLSRSTLASVCSYLRAHRSLKFRDVFDPSPKPRQWLERKRRLLRYLGFNMGTQGTNTPLLARHASPKIPQFSARFKAFFFFFFLPFETLIVTPAEKKKKWKTRKTEKIRRSSGKAKPYEIDIKTSVLRNESNRKDFYTHQR